MERDIKQDKPSNSDQEETAEQQQLTLSKDFRLTKQVQEDAKSYL